MGGKKTRTGLGDAQTTHHTDCRGSLAGPQGVCSCLGRPEMEVVGRPVELPQEWQEEEGPREGQTDPAVGVEAHSQNLQTEERRHKT